LIAIAKKGRKGSSSILIKSLVKKPSSKRRKLNDGSAQDPEAKEDGMI